MYGCPACGTEDVANREACACGADLSLLQRLDGISDAWFNRALEAVGEGATGRALEWLSACCVTRPTDAGARRLQAKVWAQLGHWEEARDALERAQAIDPNAPELAELQQALNDAVTARVEQGAHREAGPAITAIDSGTSGPPARQTTRKKRKTRHGRARQPRVQNSRGKEGRDG